MKIEKRDGSIVEFNIDKIDKAISLALGETNESLSWGLYQNLLEGIKLEIQQDYESMGEPVSVEFVSDEIEKSLMRNELYDTAKRYILWRSERARERGMRQSNPSALLTDDFISKYKHVNPPFTQLGELVYYRTYSRFLDNENRREYWWETVRRAVEYNCSLIKTSRREAEKLYDNVFNLRQFLSGRTFWVGGTDISKKYPMANYNCSFQVISDFESFRDVFYLLMIGSGVGVRVLRDDVKTLPRIRTNVRTISLGHSPVPKDDRIESTSLIFEDDSVEIVVGDSKDGWVQALNYYFNILTSNEYRYINMVILNYNNVRPKGERLKSFGGTASGHTALSTIFQKIDNLLKRNNNVELYKLKPIDVVDICNIIGEGVVVGGVRRTAEIVLFDSDDVEVSECKSKLYEVVDGEWKINTSLIHRQMSNNSVFYESKPSREDWSKHLSIMRYTGEPAFINAESARKRRPNFHGVNPCGEILLNNKGLCNLTTVNVMAFVDSNGILDVAGLREAQMLSAKASYRMTQIELELPKWDAVQKEDLLTGCSLTGWQDMVNSMGLSLDGQAKLLRELRDIAKESVAILSKEIGCKESLLVTTVKPEGTLSQLPTVSSGIHYSHAPYYIRRVRINAHDPLIKVCEEIGYPIKPEVGQDWETCTTKVVEFPVKAPEGRTKYNISAIEQLENYKLFMDNYVDHNASITVHVRADEWDAVEEWVYNNWDEVVAISFLSLDDSMYELLPYEEIDEAEYLRRYEAIDGKRITPEKIRKYETFEEFEILDSSCDTGGCPVR